jgi:A/G-specific adenine glycosylase
MLQQTQVATVIPYFERFLHAFPCVAELASAEEEDVLKLWEGLGYYRRARQLHRAAQVVVAEHGGRFPTEFDQVLALPGIGRYTAGAILSISHGERLPILEANTVRLYSRLMGYRDDPRTQRGQSALWQFAESILPRVNVGDFNQALMELGSVLCTAREPVCEDCPAFDLCVARERGEQKQIPIRARRQRVEQVQEMCVVVWRNRSILLRRRDADERWAGMWDFPRFSMQGISEEQIAREAIRRTRAITGITIRPGKRLTTIKHGVTRFRITLDCYEARYQRGRLGPGELRWVDPQDLGDYPLSVTGRKIAERIQSG